MNQSNDTERLLKLFVLLIFAGAAMLRFQNIFSALEYDEIWTLENFSVLPISKLMTDLALPNNQPLNSLWVKLIAAFNGPLWAIRLHSLIAGILLLPLVGFISYVLSGKNKTAAVACMFFMALSAPDIAYSSLARGYGLQVFFLALYSAGLTASGEFRPRDKRWHYLPECAIALGGVCAILTLPTSVIYLAAITLAAWLIHPVKPRRSLVIVLAAGAVFTLCWCLGNYQQLNAARVWGSKIKSFADFYGFLAVTTVHLLPPAVLLIGCAAFKTLPRKTLPLLLIIALPLLSAAITNAGPPRTYIPFGAVFAVAAGCGAGELLKRMKKNPAVIICVVLGILCIWEYSWRKNNWYTPDSREVFKQASRIPYSALVVHRATAGYPLAWNNQPEIYTDFVKRLLEHSRELIMFDTPTRINGNDNQNNEAVISAGTSGEEVKKGILSYTRYRLEELRGSPHAGETVLVSLRPMQEQVFQFYLDRLNKSGINWLKLNPWLNRYINRPEGTYRYALLAGTVPENCSLDWNLFTESNGSVSVYRITK